jgi:glycosyltransferase involved in cell wall biosynthesis
MNKIRVVQIINSLAIGGAERVAINIATHLDYRNYESLILTLEGSGPFSELLNEARIPYTSLHKKPGFKIPLFFRIAAQIKKWRADIITTHNYGPLLYGSIGGRIGGCRHFLHVDHARAFPSPKRYIFSEHQLVKRIYRTIAVSEELKQNLIKHEGIPGDRIDIINNGIDEKLFNQSFNQAEKKDKLGIPQGVRIIGVGVRLAEQKGLTYLLDAIKILIKDREDFHVIIAGDGPQAPYLHQKCNRLNLQQHVTFLGARMDINQIVQLLDVYVLPSIWEGLPLAVLEAMAARRAIVATNVGGIPDVIRHKDNGLLVPPGNSVELASAINYLLNNADQRKKFGDVSYDIFSKYYSAKTMAAQYASYYQRMISNHY